MKILQVVPHYIPAYRYGGPLKVAHSLGKAFVKRGHHVTVCTTNMSSETENLNVPVGEPVIKDGIEIFYEPVILFRYWGFSPSLIRRIKENITKTDIVLIHAHFQFANLVGAWLARKANKPYIIFAHSSLHTISLKHKKKVIKRLYLKFVEHRNFCKSLFIAFNAPEEKEISLYGELGQVIYNGIEPAEFSNIPMKGSFRKFYPELADKICYLFLGRLDIAQKGLDLLIPAFASLIHKHIDAHLILAGPDEDKGKDTIIKLAMENGILDRILIAGLISGDEKLALLQDSDVFVLPSRFEGLSIALLEALYFGLPVITTDKVGLSKDIQRAGAGLIVPSESEESICEALTKLADNKTRHSMQGRGTDLILEKYTWDVISQNLIEQIQGLIK
ncbi:MAG: glycosyltransferase [Thermodesulfobacteriota bacterium]|nr:glycosyltransferase [Thermodesulfobacteriota bacterium]